MSGEPRITVEELSRHVHVVRCDMPSRKSEQWFLLSSDRHHDNAFTDQGKEREHLREAVARKAGIIDCGDLFCAMQGKWDKRADRSHMREEYQEGPYLDMLVKHAAEFYAPYAKNWVLMGPGNHETAITSRHETNLNANLVERMKAKHGAKHLCLGAYTGWVRIICKRANSGCEGKYLHYHHGYGGGGPVTRDVIQSARKAVYLPDADIVLSGHTHDSWVLPIARTRINEAGTVYYDQQVHVKSPGYKRSHAQHGGWEAEKGMPPKPIGAWWLRFFWKGDHLEFELKEAK